MITILLAADNINCDCIAWLTLCSRYYDILILLIFLKRNISCVPQLTDSPLISNEVWNDSFEGKENLWHIFGKGFTSWHLSSDRKGMWSLPRLFSVGCSTSLKKCFTNFFEMSFLQHHIWACNKNTVYLQASQDYKQGTMSLPHCGAFWIEEFLSRIATHRVKC